MPVEHLHTCFEATSPIPAFQFPVPSVPRFLQPASSPHRQGLFPRILVATAAALRALACQTHFRLTIFELIAFFLLTACSLAGSGHVLAFISTATPSCARSPLPERHPALDSHGLQPVLLAGASCSHFSQYQALRIQPVAFN